jgi:hypothetical protein
VARAARHHDARTCALAGAILKSMHRTVFLLLVVLALPASALEIQRRTAPLQIDGAITDAGWQNLVPIDAFVEYARSDDTAPPERRSVVVSSRIAT